MTSSHPSRGQRIGAAVRHYREAAGLTQDELARRSGLSPSTISHWEQGARDQPRVRDVRAVAEALGVSTGALESGPPGTAPVGVVRRRYEGSFDQMRANLDREPDEARAEQIAKIAAELVEVMTARDDLARMN